MPELRKDSLSFIEALGQSVANVAPTATPTLTVTVVAALAGRASWLVFILSTISLIIVGANISKLARRSPSAGSFFLYVSRTLGPSYGMLAGWAMMVAYLLTGTTVTVGTSLFIKTLSATLGFRTVPGNIALYVLIAVSTWLFAVRDIRISSRLGLVLEVISMSIIVAVCIVTWRHYGFVIDSKQIHLTGAGLPNIARGMAFALFCSVGFESAATLGRETRNPTKAIPRAMVLTAIIAGLFFVFTTYVIVLGFGDDAAKVGASSAPLADVTRHIGNLLTALVYFCAAISGFACILASLNACARMLFSMGRYQFVHRSMGFVHDHHQTPHVALTLSAIVNLMLVVVCSRQAETDLVGYFGTVATFGFIVVYFMCSICAPLMLFRNGEAQAADIVMGVLGCATMLVALIGSVYPVPDYPYSLFPYLFLAYMLIGLGWFAVIRKRMPQALISIEHDLEAEPGSISRYEAARQ